MSAMRHKSVTFVTKLRYRQINLIIKYTFETM